MSSPRTLRLGTRRSALATTQSGWVADRLRALGHTVELVEVVTEGDTSTASLSSLGGTGVFAAALRRALLAGEVDLAVHSLKDLPTAPEPGLVVAAVPTREDPRDVLVSVGGRTLGELVPLVADLPTAAPTRRSTIPERAGRAYLTERRQAVWGFFSVSVICWVIWLVTGADFPWPIFVTVASGLNVLRVMWQKADIIEAEVRRLEKKERKELRPREDEG